MRLDRALQRRLDAALDRPTRGLGTRRVETIVPPWVNFRIKTPMPVRMSAQQALRALLTDDLRDAAPASVALTG